MTILAVCSTINFRDFTRRATIEAIEKEIETLDVLLFTSLKNFFKKRTTVKNIQFSMYYFWIPEQLKKFFFLNILEHKLRSWYWKKKISKYDWIFFTDPNQAWLLPYAKKSKIVYLIRDPNILQSINQKDNERKLLDCSELVLATSKNLTDLYLEKYHGINHKNIRYWPNCVDINIWNAEISGSETLKKPLIGVAGNFSLKRTDYSLLENITTNCPDYDFEIAGILDYNQSKVFWDRMFEKSNVKYLGNIPYEELPKTVARWNVGLVTDKMDEYASFMHHNKIYQYLALGIPVVSLKIHEDYLMLHPYVLVTEDHTQYIEAIRVALEQAKKESFNNGCIAIARLNTSEARAKEFLSIISAI
jgi:hypothetical protein